MSDIEGKIALTRAAWAFRHIGNAIADAASTAVVRELFSLGGGYLGRLCGSNRYVDIDSFLHATRVYIVYRYRAGHADSLRDVLNAACGPLDARGNPTRGGEVMPARAEVMLAEMFLREETNDGRRLSVDESDEVA